MKVTKTGKNALEITIDGEEYDVLARVAEAMNVAEPGRHTAETVCRDFLVAAPSQMLARPFELADFIIGDLRGVDDGRMAAFRDAFGRAGLWTLEDLEA